jgi:hypothetical protein
MPSPLNWSGVQLRGDEDSQQDGFSVAAPCASSQAMAMQQHLLQAAAPGCATPQPQLNQDYQSGSEPFQACYRRVLGATEKGSRGSGDTSCGTVTVTPQPTLMQTYLKQVRPPLRGSLDDLAGLW